MAVSKQYGVKLISDGTGSWVTEDGRYQVYRDDAYMTECEEPHPVKLPRDEWTSEWDYDKGEMRTVKGYQCQGGAWHNYTRWNVWDKEAPGLGGDFAFGNSPGAYLTFKAAAEDLAAELKKEH